MLIAAYRSPQIAPKITSRRERVKLDRGDRLRVAPVPCRVRLFATRLSEGRAERVTCLWI
jgi:hypothetical protein